jgi:FkbM family methyltransferase
MPRSVKFSYFELAYLLEDGWKVVNVDDNLLTLHHDSEAVTISCRYRVAADVLELEEIFLRRYYGRDFRGKVVFDVGISSGNSSIFFARMGAAKVIGLEPFPESLALAQKNIATNKLEDVITTLPLALSSTAGEGVLHFSGDRPNVSALTPTASSNNYSFDMSIPVETTTIGILLSQFSPEGIDFLKLDCEGGEYDIIRSLSREVLGKIKVIVMEFHDGAQDLPRILSRAGFAVDSDGGTVGYLRAQKS